MDILALTPAELKSDAAENCLVVPIFQEASPPLGTLLDPADASLISRLIAKGQLTGKAGEVTYIPAGQRQYHGIAAVGIGKRDALDSECARRAAGEIVKTLERHRVEHLIVDATSVPELSGEAFIEGVMLGQYCFDRYKKPVDPPVVRVSRISWVCPEGSKRTAALRDAATVAECVNWARDLAHRAPNDLTPSTLAKCARDMAAKYDLQFDALDEGHMAEKGMNALLAVARGSNEPPELIVVRYHHSDNAPTVAIVGKGVTFDSGGISIKPAVGMQEMKYDMCGAAAVLGAIKAVARLKPTVNVVAVVPSVENMPGSKAFRPGDIVRAYNGKTIEIHNTDAEGRLILADALAYTVDQFRPAKVVDLATLTGACIVALGHYAAAMTSTNDDLAEELERAASATGERVWPMPIWPEYSKLIEGTHADLCNIGPEREAGTIIGGCFLKEFVGNIPWAHLDIAGTAWGVKNIPYLDCNATTGYGVRLLTTWIRGQAK